MKRICNLVCTIIFTVLFITLINIVVRANEPEPEGWDLRGLYGNDLHQSGDFQYLVYPDMDNRAIIIGYLGTDKNLVIPNMLDGHIVEGVFNLRRKEPIKTIMLGENFGEYQALEKRDNSAMFNNISELEKLKVSKKNKYYTASKGILYSKDMTVLYNCPANLKKSKVKIPKSVKRIYDAAFDYNSTINIRPTELFYEMKSGVKKRISLLCEYEEWVLDDDGYDYTGEVTTGKIDEKSLETGIVSFVSDNPDIVSVSETGVIATGLPGKATITIQMVPEKRLCAKLVVKVTER